MVVLQPAARVHKQREACGVALWEPVFAEALNLLERRLRDLGLLVGVNDAEFMKHLRPRFQRNNQP